MTLALCVDDICVFCEAFRAAFLDGGLIWLYKITNLCEGCEFVLFSVGNVWFENDNGFSGVDMADFAASDTFYCCYLLNIEVYFQLGVLIKLLDDFENCAFLLSTDVPVMGVCFPCLKHLLWIVLLHAIS